MKPIVAVPFSIPCAVSKRRPLGIVDEIREAVRAAKSRHPSLAASHLCDVALKRTGDTLRLTLYFQTKPS